MINNENEKIWTGRKVFVKLKNINRAYTGIVLYEDSISVTIKDIKNNLVKINFEDISFIQEEQ